MVSILDRTILIGAILVVITSYTDHLTNDPTILKQKATWATDDKSTSDSTCGANRKSTFCHLDRAVHCRLSRNEFHTIDIGVDKSYPNYTLSRTGSASADAEQLSRPPYLRKTTKDGRTRSSTSPLDFTTPWLRRMAAPKFSPLRLRCPALSSRHDASFQASQKSSSGSGVGSKKATKRGRSADNNDNAFSTDPPSTIFHWVWSAMKDTVLTSAMLKSALNLYGDAHGWSEMLHEKVIVVSTRQSVSRLDGNSGTSLSVLTWVPHCDVERATGEETCHCGHAPSQQSMTLQCDSSSGMSQSSFVPRWLLDIVTMEPFTSKFEQFKLYRQMTGEKYDQIHSRCTISAPRVVPMCLRIKNNGERRDEADIGVSVVTEERLDLTFWWLMAATVAVAFVKAIVLSIPFLQVLLCAALGVVLLVLGVLFYLMKDLRDTRIGKVGIVGLFSLGGFAAISEGFVSAVFSFCWSYTVGNMYVQLVLLACSIASGAISYCFFYERLPAVTRFTLSCISLGFHAAAAIVNRELYVGYTIISMVVLFLMGSLPFHPSRANHDRKKKHDSSSSSPTTSSSTANNNGFTKQGASTSTNSSSSHKPSATSLAGSIFRAITRDDAADSDDGEPRDDLPEDAYVAQGTTLSSAQVYGRGSAREKFDKFDRDGRAHTRKALEDLARHVRKNGGAAGFSGKVFDLDGLNRFAGGGNGASMASEYSDDCDFDDEEY